MHFIGVIEIGNKCTPLPRILLAQFSGRIDPNNPHVTAQVPLEELSG